MMTGEKKQVTPRQAKQTAEVITWQEGIATIAATRRKYVSGALRDLADAERKLMRASDRLNRTKTGMGHSNGGSPAFQRAQSDVKVAQRRVNFLKKIVNIDDDQQKLVESVEDFLKGKKTPDTCGALRLGRTGRDLSIYFHDDGKKVNFDKDHGHYVIYPNGTMSYMRGQNDAHGRHNIVNPQK